MVVIAGLLGMLLQFSMLNERRREMAILRSVGARPLHIMVLMITEAVIYGVVGTALGFNHFYGLLFALQPVIQTHWGIYIAIGTPGQFEAILAVLVIGFSGLLGAIPAWLACKRSLADGLTIKV